MIGAEIPGGRKEFTTPEKADSAALKTSETISKNAIATIIPKDATRFRKKSRTSLRLGSGLTSQIRFNADCNWAKAPEAEKSRTNRQTSAAARMLQPGSRAAASIEATC